MGDGGRSGEAEGVRMHGRGDLFTKLDEIVIPLGDPFGRTLVERR